jgi:hypothetical protein
MAASGFISALKIILLLLYTHNMEESLKPEIAANLLKKNATAESCCE